MPVFSKVLTRDHNKTHAVFTFTVTGDAQEILIKGDYRPRIIEDPSLNQQLILPAFHRYIESQKGSFFTDDNIPHYEKYAVERFTPIRNLIDYTIVDPEGRMRARGSGSFFETKQITEEVASIGCIRGRLPAGEWQLIVEAHAVATPEVSVTIEVEVNNSITPGLEATQKRIKERTRVASLEQTKNQSKESRWYKGDLHVHSYHSDGTNSLDELICYFREQGYDFFMLSDHNFYAGSQDDLRGDFNEVVVLPGVEMSTFYGHALAANWPRDLPWFHLRQDDDFRELISTIHEAGGLFGVAHPYTIGDPICTGCRWDYTNLEWGMIDFLEVWNGSWLERKIEVIQALKKWEELVNSGHRIVATSGSDMHNANREKGVAATFIKADSCTAKGLFDGLRKGRVFVSQGPHIGFYLSSVATGERCSVGDELRVPQDSKAIAEISLDVTAQVELVQDGWPRYSATFDACQGKLEFTDEVTKDTWYYLRAFDRENNLLGFTNPIYVMVE